MAYNPNNPNNQATMANSSPVVIASNQSPVSVAGTVNIGTSPSIYGNISGSVIAFLGSTNASVITVGSPVANQSVSGTVGASVIGHAPVVIVGGSILTSSTPNQSVSGTVGASIIGSIPTRIEGSVAVAIISGSIAASFTPPANQSVSGTVGASVIGTVPVTQTGAWTASVVGTVGASIIGTVPVTQAGAWTHSVVGTVGASIIGTVPITQSGTMITSIVSTVPSSVIVGASIFGQLPAGTAPIGSVATLQGTNPWIVNFQNSSIIAVNAGSVVALSQGSVITVFQSPSIVGTYAEDTAYTAGDRGLFTLGMRNDTLASITSADLEYSGIALGPTGETIVANSPITKWVQGTGSMLGGVPVNGGSVMVIAAQGSSIFTYITGIQIANPSANNVFLRFDGATSSTIAFTMAPANGGSNIVFRNAIKTNANGAFTASTSGIASVYISAQGFISRT